MIRKLPAIVEQHAENAAFLWLLRDRAVLAPHISLAKLTELDGRIDAHLDGLRLAGDQGWQTCCDALAQGVTGELFAASVLALESADPGRIAVVLAVAARTTPLARAVVSAIGWVSPDLAVPIITHLVQSEVPLHRRIGVAGAAVHRINPGEVLNSSLRDRTNPLLVARALRAIGELGMKQMKSAVCAHLDSADDDIRFAAAWSACLLGERAAVRVLGGFAVDAGRYAERACSIALRCLPLRDAYKAHDEIASHPELTRLAISAAGLIGDPALVGWLLHCAAAPEAARLAGEAFTMITGADLEQPALAGEPPEGFDAGPTDDPGDENVAPDPDEHLPWPNWEGLRDWWYDYRDQFRAGSRYLLGNPIEAGWLYEVLAAGKQRQRAAAALELALDRPGNVLFEVRAPGGEQKRLLSTLMKRRS